jgi:hypothetical protein
MFENLNISEFTGWIFLKLQTKAKMTTPTFTRASYMRMTYNGRQPPMEDDLKMFKVEYLSNN